jgi:hypothetical protein
LVTGHFPNPKIAARKLLDIVRTSITDSGLPHAYTGARVPRGTIPDRNESIWFA